MDKFSVSIRKSVNKVEQPVKGKHMDVIVRENFIEKGEARFWNYTSKLPLHSHNILAWKFCTVLHQILTDGSPKSLILAQRKRGVVVDLGHEWSSAHENYAAEIKHYALLLEKKLKFHTRFPQFPGNLKITPENLKNIGGNISVFGEIAMAVTDYLQCINDLKKTIFKSLKLVGTNSMTYSGQCRLQPIILCSQDTKRLYEIIEIILTLSPSCLPMKLINYREKFQFQMQLAYSAFQKSMKYQYLKDKITPEVKEKFLNKDIPEYLESENASASELIIKPRERNTDVSRQSTMAPKKSNKFEKTLKEMIVSLDELSQQFVKTVETAKENLQFEENSDSDSFDAPDTGIEIIHQKKYDSVIAELATQDEKTSNSDIETSQKDVNVSENNETVTAESAVDEMARKIVAANSAFKELIKKSDAHIEIQELFAKNGTADSGVNEIIQNGVNAGSSNKEKIQETVNADSGTQATIQKIFTADSETKSLMMEYFTADSEAQATIQENLTADSEAQETIQKIFTADSEANATIMENLTADSSSKQICEKNVTSGTETKQTAAENHTADSASYVIIQESVIADPAIQEKNQENITASEAKITNQEHPVADLAMESTPQETVTLRDNKKETLSFEEKFEAFLDRYMEKLEEKIRPQNTITEETIQKIIPFIMQNQYFPPALPKTLPPGPSKLLTENPKPETTQNDTIFAQRLQQLLDRMNSLNRMSADSGAIDISDDETSSDEKTITYLDNENDDEDDCQQKGDTLAEILTQLVKLHKTLSTM